MKVELVRIYNCPTYCIGKLYIDGVVDVVDMMAIVQEVMKGDTL